MKVKSLSIVALIAALMAVPAATASAQGEQSEASFFEASVNGSGPPSEPEPGASGQGWQAMDGARSEDVVVEAGDPRASGLLTAITNSTEFLLSDGGIVVERDTVRLVNDEGEWVGRGAKTLHFSGGPPSQVAARWTFEGEGGYEGLTLELHGEEPDENMEVPWWGVIYPTEGTPTTPDDDAE